MINHYLDVKTNGKKYITNTQQQNKLNAQGKVFLWLMTQFFQSYKGLEYESAIQFK